MAKGGGGDTTTVQDIPAEFKPAYLALFDSAFGAAQTAAYGYPTNYPQTGGGGTTYSPYGNISNAILGSDGIVYRPGEPNYDAELQSQAEQIFTTGNFDSIEQARDSVITNQNPDWISDALVKNSGYNNGYNENQGSTKYGGEGYNNQIIGQPFEGPFNAGPHPLEKMALDQRAALGMSLQGVDIPALQLGLDTTTGRYLNPESNPYLQRSIEIAQSGVDRDLYQNALPALSSAAIQQGAFKGSSRRGVLENALVSDAWRAKGDIANQFSAQNYDRERNLQMQGPNMIDTAIRLGQLPGELLSQAGAGYRAMDQQVIEERLRQYEEGITAPFRPLIPLTNIVRGIDIGSVQTTSQPVNSFQQGITGALGGAAIGYGAGELAGGYGGYGAAIGGLAGGAAGVFGG